MHFFSPGLVFTLKKNLDFLRTSAPYLLHHAPKISKMSDSSSVLGEIMQEIWRSPISLTAPCFSETCCPAASAWRSGWTGSERGASCCCTRRGGGLAMGARVPNTCLHMNQNYWLLWWWKTNDAFCRFIDGTVSDNQVPQGCRNSSSGSASSSLHLQLSQRYSEKNNTCS